MSYFLEAERLGFRTWQQDYLPLAIALWTDPEVMGFMGGPMSTAQAEARFRTERDNQQKYGFQYWPIFDRATGAHAGCSGLKPSRGQTDVLEVGVHLARPFWGGRHGEEAARAVIAWAWHNTAAEALVAGHFPANEHSRALIGRLGFVYTHQEFWEPTATMHPYYRLERPGREVLLT